MGEITQYNVALFLHVGTVIVTFMIAAVSACVSAHAGPRQDRSKRLGRSRIWFIGSTRCFRFSHSRSSVSASGSSGRATRSLKVGDGWILTSLIALIVIEGLAGALLAPHSKKLVAAIQEAPDGPLSAELRAQSRDPFIWYLAHTATVGFLGVVFVMTNKPSGGVVGADRLHRRGARPRAGPASARRRREAPRLQLGRPAHEAGEALDRRRRRRYVDDVPKRLVRAAVLVVCHRTLLRALEYRLGLVLGVRHAPAPSPSRDPTRGRGTPSSSCRRPSGPACRSLRPARPRGPCRCRASHRRCSTPRDETQPPTCRSPRTPTGHRSAYDHSRPRRTTTTIPPCARRGP